MIRCEQARENLDGYYHEDCRPELRQELESHLAACPSCRKELDSWVRLSSRVFPGPSAKASPFLWTRVLAGIEAQEGARAAAPWWVQWRWMSWVTAAASVLVLTASTFLFQASTPPLDTLLEGETTHQEAIQLASLSTAGPDQTNGIVLGGTSWVED